MTADAAGLRVLVVNAGSSSLKLRVLGPGDELEQEADPDPGDAAGLAAWLGTLEPVDAVGHRVVHGGSRFTAPVLLDDAVVAELVALTELAPLHQPAALAAMEAVGGLLPGVPAVACFDTAFHATLSPAASTYPLPRAWREEHGLRRFGFHGLSHAYAARHAGGGRVVTCHLGAGASLAAVRDGRCVDTTMGFTPLEGVVMATRSGTVDPGLVLWLLRHGHDLDEVQDGLEHGGGLRGLAGTADMREVLERDDADARLALDVYVHRLRAAIAAMAAAAGGLDTLVFTGGVGERAPVVRAAACDGLGFLGVAVDGEANAATTADGDITAAGAEVRTLVVAAREDLEVARAVRGLVAARHAPEPAG